MGADLRLRLGCLELMVWVSVAAEDEQLHAKDIKTFSQRLSKWRGEGFSCSTSVFPLNCFLSLSIMTSFIRVLGRAFFFRFSSEICTTLSIHMLCVI